MAQPPAYITAVGSALPSLVLSNEQLLAGMPWLDTSADWLREHTGIRSRHVAEPHEHATDLGIAAAQRALQRVPEAAAQTDLVLLATNTARFVYPAGAALIQEGLAARGHRLPRASALDLQGGCASFVSGIVLAAAMVASGTCRQVLVVGAEVCTRMVDWTDRSALLLGDGAAACLVASRPPAQRDAPCLELLGSCLRTAPDADSIQQRGVLDERNHPLQHIAFAATIPERVTRERLYARLDGPPGGDPARHFRMDGRKVYRFVRRMVPASGFLEAMHRAGLVDDDELAWLEPPGGSPRPAGDPLRAAIGRRVDRFVPHGANMVLDQELADQLHVPYDRMALTLPEHGNTSAASVGVALDRILRTSLSYETIAKRDGDGNLTRPAREVVVEPIAPGHHVLLLSFGAGTSWTYLAARAV